MANRLNLISNQTSAKPFSIHANLKSKYLADPLDFMNLGQSFGKELNQKRKAIRAALQRDIAPIVPEYYEKAQFPFQIIPKMKALNLFGISEQKYGCRKLTTREKAMITFELSRIDNSISTFYSVQQSLVIATFDLVGSEAQKEKYLAPLCNLDQIGCWGLTEPDYGSDASSLQTLAEPVAGGFKITGLKRWIGNASMSDIMIIYARNTQTKKVQPYIVPTKSPGVTINDIQRKLALRIVLNGNIQLQQVFVPTENLMEKGQDFETSTNVVLQASRKIIPWMVTGITAGVYQHAVQYIRDRVAFKAPLAAFQLNQEKVVRILSCFLGCFLYSMKEIELIESNQSNIAQAALGKAWTTQLGREAARLGREMLGGNGIIIDNYMIKALADMEVVSTYEGTYDVNTLVAGRAITGVAAFKTAYRSAKQYGQLDF